MAEIVDGVEHQFRLAARTLYRLRGQDRPKTVLTYWPDILQSYIEGYGRHAIELRPAIPSPHEIDQLDRVLQWLWLIERTDWPLVWARAAGLSWRRVARQVGLDHMTAKRHFEAAMARVAEHVLSRGLFA